MHSGFHMSIPTPNFRAFRPLRESTVWEMDHSTSPENGDHVLHEDEQSDSVGNHSEFEHMSSQEDDHHFYGNSLRDHNDNEYDEEEESEEEEEEDDSYEDDDEEDDEEDEDEDDKEDIDHEPLHQQGGQYNYSQHDFSDSLDEFEGSHEEEISRLIASTNKLLADVGIERKKITSKEELIRVAPSMVVAVFEALYHARIEEIERNPTTRKHYERNAQLVIDNLSEQISIPLTHISGKSIVEGDLRALSNLVYIFKRIVTLTTSSQQSLSSIESNEDGAGEKHRIRSGDSISTKDSLLDQHDTSYAPMLSPKKSHSEPDSSHYYHHHHHHHQQQHHNNISNNANHLHNITQSQHDQGVAGGGTATHASSSLPPSSNTMSQSLLDSYIQKSLHKVDKQLDLELRQHRATRRRKTLQFIKQNKSMQENARRRAKALEAKQRKSMDDLVFQDRSHQLQKMNEEIVLLREVYSSLYKEEIKLKVDEEKLMRHRQENAREYVQNHVENMERLFRQRVEMLQEQEKTMLDAHPPTNNDLLEGVIHRIGDQQRLLMEKERATVQQQRDRLLMWRRESYQDLLSLLGAEKWSENLRQYSVADAAASPVDRRVQETVEMLNARTNMPPTSPLRPFKSHPVLPPPKTPVPGSIYGLRVVRRPTTTSNSSKPKQPRSKKATGVAPTAGKGNLRQQAALARAQATSHSATTAERRRQETRLMEEAFALPARRSSSDHWATVESSQGPMDSYAVSSPKRASTTMMASRKRNGSAAVMSSPNNRKGSRVTY